jgi:hypothetical protein
MLAKDLVGQTPQTIYMYLAEGAAVDYGGVFSAAADKNKLLTRKTLRHLLLSEQTVYQQVPAHTIIKAISLAPVT